MAKMVNFKLCIFYHNKKFIVCRNEIIFNILFYNLHFILNNERRTPFHINKYVLHCDFLWPNIYFILWMYHLLLRAVLKQIKSISPLLFKWIHRELCDAWQRTGEITRWWKLKPPWVLKLCLPCSNDSLSKLLYCSDVNMAASLFFLKPSIIFFLFV